MSVNELSLRIYIEKSIKDLNDLKALSEGNKASIDKIEKMLVESANQLADLAQPAPPLLAPPPPIAPPPIAPPSIAPPSIAPPGGSLAEALRSHQLKPRTAAPTSSIKPEDKGKPQGSGVTLDALNKVQLKKGTKEDQAAKPAPGAASVNLAAQAALALKTLKKTGTNLQAGRPATSSPAAQQIQTEFQQFKLKPTAARTAAKKEDLPEQTPPRSGGPQKHK